MVVSKHLANASIILTECMALRDGVLTVKKKKIGFLDLEIKGDSKVIIDCYNKKKKNLVQLFY